ncbi:hypothetical protein EN873_45690 [bacterium M00.F.Ca.ET.230.01.1.1]|nr:hypothetical protein EN873_45690 [bacterium M00.F.Ca.ET.230.01.1.1]
MNRNLYSIDGKPFAYITDDGYIYEFNGKAYGYFTDNNIYSLAGDYLAWLSDGWVYSSNGKAIFYLA